MAAKAKEPNPAAVDAWLTRLPKDQRAELQRLREQIRAAALVRKIVKTRLALHAAGKAG